MKLDTRRTILIGFAFLSISAFWQMYDNLIPLILDNTFAINKTISGVIMAADNVLALFLLPLFGGLSDKCTNRMGRRRPFILYGSIAAVVLMMCLPLLDNSYFAAPSTLKMMGFIVILGCLLVAMGTYRSPAVALMPDVTPKPLRSKGNAIINLMGAVGGILYLVLSTVLSKLGSADSGHKNYLPMFASVAVIMIVAVVILMTRVNEPALVAEQKRYEDAHPEENLAKSTDSGEKLPKEVKKSLAFLLISIALWFIGYNAVTTWFSTYSQNVWNMDLSQANPCLTIATAGAIVSYIPVGNIASRVGRRKTIGFGVILLAASFFSAFLYTLFFSTFNPVLYVVFVLVGVAWAAINVNSLPMVVEMCKGSEVGKFTGLYYSFSMSAQTITPVLSGALLEYVGYKTLFPYAAIFVALSFVTMLFVRHGDNKVEAKKGLEAFDVDD